MLISENERICQEINADYTAEEGRGADCGIYTSHKLRGIA